MLAACASPPLLLRGKGGHALRDRALRSFFDARAWLRCGVGSLAVAALACGTGVREAHAQAGFSPIVDVVISPEFSRDRNVGVREESNPDYDALGLRLGGLVAFPSLSIGGGATNNVYSNNVGKLSDVYVAVKPSVYVRSDWSRHSVTFQISDESRRYAINAPRNQDQWFTNFSGKFDLASDFTLQLDVQAGHFFEAPFASEATSYQQILSNYDQRMAGIKTAWASERLRLTGGYDHSVLSFSRLNFSNGTSSTQAYRDRSYDRGYVQAEYAFSPSLATFVQMQVEQASYVLPVAFGSPNRDSTVQRYVAGISFDLAGSVRGAVGLGYTARHYKSSLYPFVGGISGQAEVDVFLSALTNVKLVGQRILQEATLGNAYAYTDTRASVTIDHALRRNIIFSPLMEWANQQNIGENSGRSYLRTGGYVTYQMNRQLALRWDLSYTSVTSKNNLQVGKYSELAGIVAITFRI